MSDTSAFEAGALTFEQWLRAVDIEVVKITGLSTEDFADWNFSDAYEDGIEPRQAAIDMLADDAIGLQFLKRHDLDGEVSF